MGRGHISFARVVSGAESAPAQGAAPRQLREEPFTHGQVLQQWDAYMTRDPKAHLLNNTLRMHKPALPEGASARVSGPREAASFVVRVVNSAQVDVLNQEKPRLLEAIRSAIGNDFFDFASRSMRPPFPPPHGPTARCSTIWWSAPPISPASLPT